MKIAVKIYCLVTLLVVGLLLSGCDVNSSADHSTGDAVINIVVRSSINQDLELWEDRVDHVRMVVFDVQSGDVVYNERLGFPNGLSGSSLGIEMLPDVYDFCFIANEESYPTELKAALSDIANKSDLTADVRFKSLSYNPNFVPDGTTDEGLFPMSAIYNGITVAAGGTKSNPLPLQLPGSGKVEFVRPMSKVEVIFRKKVSGSTIPESALINSVKIDNVASTISVPPHDNYYEGELVSTNPAVVDGFDYEQDSMGAVTFYIPEIMFAANSDGRVELNINNNIFPLTTNDIQTGMVIQRRSIPDVSNNSIIRNYHYIVNANVNTNGELRLEVHFEPWKKKKYIYIFEGDFEMTLPSIEPTDTSIIIPTECGMIEMHTAVETLSGGLREAYNYTGVDWNNQTFIGGDPPYYCENKYGPGWRLVNACELMSSLGYLDEAYSVWASNTWEANGVGMKPYPIAMRVRAQEFIELFSGLDLSDAQYEDESRTDVKDNLGQNKDLNMMWGYFTTGELIREDDFPGGWPYQGAPATNDTWYYQEMVIQARQPWAAGYISPADRDNWDRLLYREFHMFEYAAKSRCIREVE